MILSKTLALLYILSASILFVVLTARIFEYITDNTNRSYRTKQGIFLFFIVDILLFAFGSIGYFDNEINKFLRNHERLLLLIFIFSVLWFGLYLFAFKTKLPVLYSIIEISFGCLALVVTVLPKSSVFEDVYFTDSWYILFSTMGYLYVMVRGLENIDKKSKSSNKGFAFWNFIKVWLLRIEQKN